MILFILIVSGISIVFILMDWINEVQVDIWLWHLEDAVMSPSVSVCGLIPVIIVALTIIPLIIPRTMLFRYPDNDSSTTRIRRKLKRLPEGFIYMELSGHPSKFISHKDLVNKRWNLVCVTPVAGAQYYVDEPNDLLILQTEKWEIEDLKMLNQKVADLEEAKEFWKFEAVSRKMINRGQTKDVKSIESIIDQPDP